MFLQPQFNFYQRQEIICWSAHPAIKYFSNHGYEKNSTGCSPRSFSVVPEDAVDKISCWGTSGLCSPTTGSRPIPNSSDSTLCKIFPEDERSTLLHKHKERSLCLCKRVERSSSGQIQKAATDQLADAKQLVSHVLYDLVPTPAGGHEVLQKKQLCSK